MQKENKIKPFRRKCINIDDENWTSVEEQTPNRHQKRAKSTARAWYYSGTGSTTFLYYSHVYIALDKSMH